MHTYRSSTELIGRAAGGEAAVATVRARSTAGDNDVTVETVVGDDHRGGVDRAVVAVVEVVDARMTEVSTVAVGADVEANLDRLNSRRNESESSGNGGELELHDGRLDVESVSNDVEAMAKIEYLQEV